MSNNSSEMSSYNSCPSDALIDAGLLFRGETKARIVCKNSVTDIGDGMTHCIYAARQVMTGENCNHTFLITFTIDNEFQAERKKMSV